MHRMLQWLSRLICAVRGHAWRGGDGCRPWCGRCATIGPMPVLSPYDGLKLLAMERGMEVQAGVIARLERDYAEQKRESELAEAECSRLRAELEFARRVIAKSESPPAESFAICIDDIFTLPCSKGVASAYSQKAAELEQAKRERDDEKMARQAVQNDLAHSNAERDTARSAAAHEKRRAEGREYVGKQLAQTEAQLAVAQKEIESLNALYIQSREARATHRCNICDAKWIQLYPFTWTLASQKCGKCCDNVAMGEQIEAIGLTAEVERLKARMVGVSDV